MNKNVIGVEISGIRKFYNEVVKFPEAISLTLGQPDFQVPEKVKEAMIRAIEEGKTTYTANAGIVELRDEISNLLKNTFDIDFNKDEIIITVGGSEGLYAAMTAVLNPGEKVLVPSIAYPAYESISKIIGCEVVNYELNEDFSVNIESLKEGIKKGGRLLILSYPCNPTGALLTKESRDELIKIIKENDILVLTDEIYSSLCFEEEYYSVAQCKDIKDKLIYVNGFSKMFSMTGLRIGYVASVKEIYNQIIKVHQYNVSCATSIAQWGALEGIKSCMNNVEKMKESFKERMNFTYKRLVDMGLDVEKPKGAFYIYPNVSKFGLTSEEFCQRLLKEGGVACVPGDAFGKGGEGYIRISYCYSKNELERALDKLEAFINTLKK
ncbi:pyridoxal phosphate-dependent aminotransferase [Clostridium sp. LIBA-8841]|uniref:pyridoxal phosphate-dependent aminotransferase n=1 Tax=Clostridium sp. LIBA-8841 TaxID=2987530 RepID=UPI002AC53273|nr:aminotransferase class I/II-fold pyridoxal phosphate-dependent enzyme [Clostridium sp. LIBA-8841]MDZ5252850.1 aminotransferase class I/II-fold pyridoxal phosphate-dependent enzyme [Clostridium sp. LIBA-8841]